MLSVICSWFKRGKGKQFQVPTRWGSEARIARQVLSCEQEGRLNVIGVWSIHGDDAHLEYRLLEGSCKQPDVVSFLRWQAAICDPERPTVIVLDNATFHRGRELKALKNEWESQGLVLRYLPSHCPFLNVIEGVWRVVKGFLMPRRYYNSVEELRAAVLVAFKALRAVEV